MQVYIYINIRNLTLTFILTRIWEVNIVSSEFREVFSSFYRLFTSLLVDHFTCLTRLLQFHLFTSFTRYSLVLIIQAHPCPLTLLFMQHTHTDVFVCNLCTKFYLQVKSRLGPPHNTCITPLFQPSKGSATCKLNPEGNKLQSYIC